MTSTAARRADRAPRDGSRRGPRGLAGGAAALAIALAIFTRYRLDDTLSQLSDRSPRAGSSAAARANCATG